jgi:hypothetical protein
MFIVGCRGLWLYAYPRLIPSMKRYYPKENEKYDQIHNKKAIIWLYCKIHAQCMGLKTVRYDRTSINYQEYWKRIT